MSQVSLSLSIDSTRALLSNILLKDEEPHHGFAVSRLSPSYANLSNAAINSSISSIDISTALDLKDIVDSSFIEAVVDFHDFHCQKCGLYIEVHPELDEEGDGWSKVFICSRSLGPHDYGLCYHCGLLYGINPHCDSTEHDLLHLIRSQISSQIPSQISLQNAPS